MARNEGYQDGDVEDIGDDNMEGRETGAAVALETIGEEVGAEIDRMIATSKRWPRDITKFKRDVLTVCTADQETAGECIYTVPRGGKKITGPSVRMAEILFSSWGNVRGGTRVTGIGDKFVRCQAVVMDLERNTYFGWEVMRRITNKEGRRYNDDMIQTTAGAAQSIAFRNAVLKVVPKAIWAGLLKDVKRCIAGKLETMDKTRAAAVEYFVKQGISEDRIFSALGRKGIESLDLDDIVALRGIATAIREGETTLDEAFPPAGVSASHKMDLGETMRRAGATPPDAPTVAPTPKPPGASNGASSKEVPGPNPTQAPRDQSNPRGAVSEPQQAPVAESSAPATKPDRVRIIAQIMLVVEQLVGVGTQIHMRPEDIADLSMDELEKTLAGLQRKLDAARKT